MKPRITVQMQKYEYDFLLNCQRNSWGSEADIDSALAFGLSWNAGVEYGSLNYTLKVMHSNKSIATYNLVCD